MALFDCYVFVDWSARNGLSPPSPAADAVWVGELRRSLAGACDRVRATYWRSRLQATRHVERQLHRAVADGLRTLVGFDFPYGYPSGFAGALASDSSSAPWQYVWDAVTLAYHDGPDNLNNRFEVAEALNARCRASGTGPFWCCPVALASPWLTVKRATARFPFISDSGRSLAEYRRCDRRVLDAGRRIHSVWQLLGTGSVGGQALAGIPYVSRLRHAPALDPVSQVWPFETGLTEEPVGIRGPAVVHAEIWPSLANPHLRPGDSPKDRAQVLAMLRWISQLDARSELSALFNPRFGPDTSAEELRACVEEEGWILGVG